MPSGIDIEPNNVSLYITIKDGEYMDSYIETNFTFNLDNSSPCLYNTPKNKSANFIYRY